jgi:hypothetical protein
MARARFPFPLLALPLLLLAAPALATTYVPMTDGELADEATVIAEVRIDAVQPPSVGAPLATSYPASILRRLKGSPKASSIVVRVPGGERPDGLSLRIPGAPRFRPGDRPLLFLTARRDGTYAVLGLLLGAFPTVELSGRRIALQDLRGAMAVTLPGQGDAAAAGADRPRDLDRFAAWLADRSRGVERPADYFVDLPKSALRSLSEKFTLLTGGERHLRWFDFDAGGAGGTVSFLANPSGQPGLAGGGFDELQRAMAAWNAEPHTPIRLSYGGTTTAKGGITTNDHVNALLWDDPNDEIGVPFDCKHVRGPLAVGVPWYDITKTQTFQGETMVQIVGADILTNKNLACYWSLFSPEEASKTLEEILTHELGHTLGLGHSCGDPFTPPCDSDPEKDDALMRAIVHADGRGGRLNPDDVASLRYLYDPSPRAATSCRPSATTLCLDGKRFKVELDWHNQFDGSEGLGRAVPATDATGYFSFGDPGNLELLVKVLDFGGPIKVFYGELTNLGFDLTVTDTETGAIKVYGNTDGDCGAIDQSYYTLPEIAFAPRAAAGRCRPDKTTLCLLDGRFALHVHWQNPFDGSRGEGGASRLSNFVGTFFFSDSNNVELMTKVLPFPDRIALFYGALTDFDYTLEVDDLLSGQVKTYHGTPGRLCGGLDNDAF